MADVRGGPIHGRTGADLMGFLSALMRRGTLTPQTGADYIVACREILALTVGEGWEDADVTPLGPALVWRRLVAAKGEVQASRFEHHFVPAINLFRTYHGLDVVHWPSAATPARSPAVEPITRDPSHDRKRIPMKAPPASAAVGLVPHLFPLRTGLFATLVLPTDLTEHEAARLTTFIHALAVAESAEAAPDSSGNGTVAIAS